MAEKVKFRDRHGEIQVVKLDIERPKNWRYREGYRNHETGEWEIDANEFVTDEFEVRCVIRDFLLYGEQETRRGRKGKPCGWLRENRASYLDEENGEERVIPSGAVIREVRVTKGRRPDRIYFEVRWSQAIKVYEVQSDWSHVMGTIPHAGREVFYDRASAEADCKAANDSPFTRGGKSGFYVSEKVVREIGEEHRDVDVYDWPKEVRPSV